MFPASRSGVTSQYELREGDKDVERLQASPPLRALPFSSRIRTRDQLAQMASAIIFQALSMVQLAASPKSRLSSGTSRSSRVADDAAGNPVRVRLKWSSRRTGADGKSKCAPFFFFSFFFICQEQLGVEASSFRAFLTPRARSNRTTDVDWLGIGQGCRELAELRVA